MAGVLKKYLDSYLRVQLKKHNCLKSAKLPSKNDKGEVFDACRWLFDLFSIDITDVLPNTQKQFLLFEIMGLPIAFKQSLRALCEVSHPLIIKEFEDAGVDSDRTIELITLAVKFNEDYLDYFALFFDDLDRENFSRQSINERIFKLSEDSEAGTIISHSAKMTNPECKFPRVYVETKKSIDGYVRTGNCNPFFDMHINSAKLKVFKFLSLRSANSNIKNIIKSKDSKQLAAVFGVEIEQAEVWIENFIGCLFSQDYRTHHFIRQVYFPIDDGYHQLSMLVPSGIVFELKNKVDAINTHGVAGYIGRHKKKNGLHAKAQFMTISNLTEMKHGGDHPKNISGLNNKNQSFYLLNSAPPMIKKRDLHFPTKNFFTQSLNPYHYRDLFLSLHKLYISPINNSKLRSKLDDYFSDLTKKDKDGQASSIVGRIIETVWAMRKISPEQYHEESSDLPQYQRIWLCEGYDNTKREESDDWLDAVEKEMQQWLHNSYEKVIGKKAIKFGPAEFQYLADQVSINREALR